MGRHKTRLLEIRRHLRLGAVSAAMHEAVAVERPHAEGSTLGRGPRADRAQLPHDMYCDAATLLGAPGQLLALAIHPSAPLAVSHPWPMDHLPRFLRSLNAPRSRSAGCTPRRYYCSRSALQDEVLLMFHMPMLCTHRRAQGRRQAIAGRPQTAA